MLDDKMAVCYNLHLIMCNLAHVVHGLEQVKIYDAVTHEHSGHCLSGLIGYEKTLEVLEDGASVYTDLHTDALNAVCKLDNATPKLTCFK